MATEALQFNKFEIYSNEIDESIDVRGGTPRIEYRESVFVPYITLKAAIVDTGNTAQTDNKDTISLLESITCQGSEKVLFAIEDAKGNKIKLTNDDDLMISEVSTVKQATKATSFVATIVSKEAFTNALDENNCVSRYEGPINQIVEDIIKDDLKSEKKVNVDYTNNSYAQWGDGRDPFKLILDLQKISVPYMEDAEGNMAGYLFWQTSEGFHFRSLDKMFATTGEQGRIQRTTGRRIKKFISTQKVDKVMPPGYDDKILDYRIVRNTSALEQVKAGAWDSQMTVFNRLESKAKTIANRTQDTPTIRGGKGPLTLNADIADKPSMNFNSTNPLGNTFWSLNSIETQVNEYTDQPAYSPEAIVQASIQNYRQKFNISMEVKIDGDFSLHAGDLVHIDVPELSSKKTIVRSPKDSGIYMIADLCHFADKTQTYTGLHLVRDTYGVKTT